MKTHKFDTVSFVSGLVFTGFGLMFLIPNTADDLLDSIVEVGTWAWPLILLGIGLAILLPLFITGQRSAGAQDEESQDELDPAYAD
jgi:hypothetical protein